MKPVKLLPLIVSLGIAGCASKTDELVTIGSLKHKPIVLEEPSGELPIDEETARKYYQEFLSITTDYDMYSQALRRLADIQLSIGEENITAGDVKSEEEGQRDTQASIRLYTTYLEQHPNDPNNDQILYQLAKAYELNGEAKKSLEILDRLIHFYPNSKYRDEVQFRRGELLFVLKRYQASEQAYLEVIKHNKNSVFYEKAMYKYGWTQFKQGRNEDALHAFMTLMDIKQQQGLLNINTLATSTTGSEKEIIFDTLRAISLNFSYLDSEDPITTYFNKYGNKPYEALIYLSVGDFLLKKERIKDAADTYMFYVQRYPTSPYAPIIHTKAIDAYQQGGLISLVLPAKEEFVRLYGVGSAYWELQNEQSRAAIRPLLETHITEIATHYHAQARKSKKSPDYLKATKWYKEFIKNFPNGSKTPQMNFLMAEAYYDGRYFIEAAKEYENSAYKYPRHKNSAEAGYAVVLSYYQVEKYLPKKFPEFRDHAINMALRFAKTFPDDKRVTKVLVKTADQLFKAGDHLRAASTAQTVVKMNIQDKELAKNAWIILGHSEFELGNYAEAETAYRNTFKYITPKDKQYRPIYDNLAASIYKQGEKARDEGKNALAVEHFLRIGKVTPSSKLVPVGEYDAASVLITMKDYRRASGILENFRKKYPKHKLNDTSINEKLALIYSETGQSDRAAREMEQLAHANRANKKLNADLLWQAATYYEKAKLYKDARRVYQQYIKNHPYPLERSIEARHKLAEDARRRGAYKEWGKWLQEIIRADARGGQHRTDRTRYLAADATLKLADGHRNAYKRVKLRQPLKPNLKKKKKLMQNAIKAYETAIKYRVADITTAATYQIAELYNDFAQSLMNSEVPRHLKGDAIEEYKLILEEKAFPFEEKAINIHTANVEQMREGVYDEWVEKSLNVLRKVQPGRYNKQEKQEAYVEAIH